MDAHHCAGAFAVDVHVADKELIASPLDMFGVGRVDGAGEAINGVIGHRQGMVEVARFGDSEYRPKDFFLKNARFALDVGKNGGLYEASVRAAFDDLCYQPSFFLTN